MVETIRILIADDTDTAREGMKRVLTDEPDMEIIGEGTTVHETIQKACELHADVLLLDLKWFNDEQAGIDMIGRLKSEAPQTKVVAITVYPHLAGPARRAGALAVVPKDIPKRQLVEEIRNVSKLPLLPPVVQAVTSSVPPVEELTRRELEVLELLAKGKRDSQIARALTIAESTAKNHVSNILGKLGVPNRAGAVVRGYELGLISAKKS